MHQSQSPIPPKSKVAQELPTEVRYAALSLRLRTPMAFNARSLIVTGLRSRSTTALVDVTADGIGSN